MTLDFIESKADDADAILALYPLAFPDEDLTSLVKALLPHPDILSLVGIKYGVIVAHALYSSCTSTAGDEKLSLLGPIAVHPDHQGGGIGTAMMAHAAERLKAAGTREILVLGNPDYYGARGFDIRASVEPPFPLKPEWAEAWRSMSLAGAPRATGRLIAPEPWMQPEYWT